MQPNTIKLLAQAAGWIITVACLAGLGCKTDTTASSGDNTAGIPAIDTMRIVSVGATATEVLVALGLSESIVAIDRTSANVEGAIGKPVVGMYSKLSAEGILSQSPTHILGVSSAGPEAVLEQLRSTGIKVSLHDAPESLEGTKSFINALGADTETADKATAILDYLSADIDRLKAYTSKLTQRPKAMFLYARGTRTLMVSGSNTAADEMMRLAGATNAITGADGFVPLTAEAAIKAAPDVIIVPKKGAASVGGVEGVIGLPGIAQTPAGQKKRIVTMDDLKLLSFGPKCGEAALELSQQLAGGSPQ